MALLDKGSPEKGTHPLLSCSDEVINRFVESLKMRGGVLMTAYFGDVADVLTFNEFGTLFERLGIPYARFSLLSDRLCVNSDCQASNNNICNTDNCK